MYSMECTVKRVHTTRSAVFHLTFIRVSKIYVNSVKTRHRVKHQYRNIYQLLIHAQRAVHSCTLYNSISYLSNIVFTNTKLKNDSTAVIAANNKYRYRRWTVKYYNTRHKCFKRERAMTRFH